MAEVLHAADYALASALGWQLREEQYQSLIDGKPAACVMHRRPHFPEKGDYSWVPWGRDQRFTESMDACEDYLYPLLDRNGLDLIIIIRVRGKAIVEAWKGPLHVATCTGSRMAEAYAVALTRALERLGEISVAHEPCRTPDGAPAHGRGVCDGEDWCSCDRERRYASCTGCGGQWPKCAEPVQ